VQATAAYTAFSAGASVFKTGKEFDSLDASMRLFAKDDAGVAKTMAYIRSESERLGTNLQQATEGFTKFSIVARNKMTESQRMEFFSGFSEYATVMQIDQHRFQRSMMAIQQMLSKSKISSEELNSRLLIQ
jgi:phage tail tape-measure protein